MEILKIIFLVIFAKSLTFTSCFQSSVPHRIFPGRGTYGNDDIILTADQTANGILDPRYRWSEGMIPYVLDSTYNVSELYIIREAMAHIEEKTCITFEPKRRCDRDWIVIKRAGGCRSNVGRIGGAQLVNLEGSECLTKDVIIHVLVHTIGFRHEQNRFDRDSWVDIQWGNIEQSDRGYFEKSPEEESFGFTYDYLSLMHFGGYDFAVDPSKPTIIPKRLGFTPNTVSNNNGLTPWDADKINIMYKEICSHLCLQD